MRLIVVVDDGSKMEIEDMGQGNWKASFQDGIQKQPDGRPLHAETVFDIRAHPNIAKLILASQHMVQDLRLGTPTAKRA
jgi:hypothetical protein